MNISRPSPRYAATLGALVAAGAVLSACGTTDAAPVSAVVKDTAASSKTQAATTYLAECMADNLVQKPKTFTLTCGDSNQALEQLDWKGWGEKQASASGVAVTNACEPSCAESDKLLTQKVKVVADGLVQDKGSARYTTLRVVADGAHPQGTIDDETFTLPGAAQAAN